MSISQRALATIVAKPLRVEVDYIYRRHPAWKHRPLRDDTPSQRAAIRAHTCNAAVPPAYHCFGVEPALERWLAKHIAAAEVIIVTACSIVFASLAWQYIAPVLKAHHALGF